MENRLSQIFNVALLFVVILLTIRLFTQSINAPTPVVVTATPPPTQEVIVVTATPLPTQEVVIVTATPLPTTSDTIFPEPICLSEEFCDTPTPEVIPTEQLAYFRAINPNWDFSIVGNPQFDDSLITRKDGRIQRVFPFFRYVDFAPISAFVFNGSLPNHLIFEFSDIAGDYGLATVAALDPRERYLVAMRIQTDFEVAQGKRFEAGQLNAFCRIVSTQDAKTVDSALQQLPLKGEVEVLCPMELSTNYTSMRDVVPIVLFRVLDNVKGKIRVYNFRIERVPKNEFSEGLVQIP